MTLTVFTDGGSKGNPGPAAIGIVFYTEKKVIHTYREDIGHATNNDAEYTAVIRALEIIRDKRATEWNTYTTVHFNSDSQLVVSQLTGVYKVKHPQIREYILRIRNLEGEVGLPITYKYVPREHNRVADALVNDKYTPE